MIGVYEYCGIQRCGKSTVMMCDLVSKILPAGYRTQDIHANFSIKIPGVHCMHNDELIQKILAMKRTKVRNQVIMFDECGQELRARGYMDKVQTEVVGFTWQMPKMGWLFMYCSNVGNSADIILRDATWYTIMPRYYHGTTRLDDAIELSVIHNYDARITRGIWVRGFQGVQDLFDSYEPID